MSLPRELVRRASARIVKRFSLVEETAAESGPLLKLSSPLQPGGPVGEVRVWRGDPLHVMVYVGLGINEIDLDTHSLHAFTKPTSAVPHFALDAVAAGGAHAYHLDLIPRVDLASHLQYVRYCYDLLTDTTLEMNRIGGLVPAGLSPLQYAMASPWMLAHSATEAALVRAGEAVEEYLGHWFALLEDGLPPHVADEIDDTWLPRRDRRLRANLVDPGVDPGWAQLEILVGDAAVDAIRALMQGDAPEDPGLRP